MLADFLEYEVVHRQYLFCLFVCLFVYLFVRATLTTCGSSQAGVELELQLPAYPTAHGNARSLTHWASKARDIKHSPFFVSFHNSCFWFVTYWLLGWLTSRRAALQESHCINTWLASFWIFYMLQHWKKVPVTLLHLTPTVVLQSVLQHWN